MLDEILAKLDGLSPDDRKALEDEAIKATEDLRFIPTVGPQTAAYFSQADILLYGGQPGGGKLLDSRTLVPVPITTSPTGYKRHGELHFGDEVYGADGNLKKVIKRHPFTRTATAFEVEFSTGEVIKACEDHLWLTWTRKDRDRLLRGSDEWRRKRREARESRAKENSLKPWVSKSITTINQDRQHEIKQPCPAVRSTREIYDTLYRQDGGANHSIDVVLPVDGVDQRLPIEPYLFGLWLGDGYTNKPYIIMMQKDWANIEDHLPDCASVQVEGQEQRRKQTVEVRRFTELNFVRKTGRKRIPAIYLRASRNQRLALLQGMMDTDGTCNSQGQCELGFSNRRLAHDALDLINSLGHKCTVRAKHLAKREHKTHWRIKFLPDECVFRLPRKASLWVKPVRSTVDRRYIVDVRPCEPVLMNCLTVEDGLYCVGRSHIVTHNTGLLVGLAVNEHERSLLVRRQFTDVEGMVDNAKSIVGTSEGFVGGNRPKYNSNGRVIHFEGLAKGDGIDTSKQGTPHDFIGVDEAAQLPRNAVMMLLGWNRTNKKGQRCRMVLASNPPLTSTGDWLGDAFAPWLDPAHPNPAKAGELRWYYIGADGRDVEADGPDTVVVDGQTFYTHSRTFIPSGLEDNPYIDKEDYQRRLQAMPEPYRTMLTSGNFLAARKDQDFQVIPTDWVRKAQARWSEDTPRIPMCAMGVDPVGGGTDEMVIAVRRDGWFAPLICEDGEKFPNGEGIGGLIVTHRRDGADVVIDMGGGFGNLPFSEMKANDIEAYAYKGAEKTSLRTADGKLRFTNTRSAAYWRMREALDPNQDGGSPIMLPPDAMLVSDLTAPIFEVTANGIKVEPKEKVKDKLGRSPDRGDAVVMAWFKGDKQKHIKGGWSQFNRSQQPQVVTKYNNAKRTSRR